LTALPFGDSGSLNVGDYVVAIGNPFGLGGSVTFGIVSGLGRTGLSAENYEDFIQTDASVNPGNSGGGLINLKGELMGINTAILAPSGGNIGIGFAVPSNMTLTVMEQLIGYGEVRRGRLGFGIQDLTPDLAATLGLPPDSRGAVVTQVEPGSPADKAGIRPRDVVVAVNGRPLRGASDLRNHVGLARVGEELELTLLRDGQQRTARARVGGTNSTASGDTGRMERDANRLRPALAGATVRDIAPGMPMHGKIEGVVVVEVEPGSPAAARGLRPGDVIVAINRNPVRNVAELSAALGPGTRRPLALDVMRGDQPLFLVIA
jgi:serine protease Do/serine protease DegQ